MPGEKKKENYRFKSLSSIYLMEFAQSQVQQYHNFPHIKVVKNIVLKTIKTKELRLNISQQTKKYPKKSLFGFIVQQDKFCIRQLRIKLDPSSNIPPAQLQMILNQVIEGFLSYERRTPLAGYIYAFVGYTCMAGMQITAKILVQDISTAHMLYLRSVCLLAINTVIMVITGHKFYPRSSKTIKILSLRSLVAAAVVYIYFDAVNCLSISIINAIWMTVPMWTHFVEFAIIGTPVKTQHFVATLVSFVGILLIVKPEAIFGQASSIDMVCCLILLVGALLNSVNMVLLRMLRSRATNDTCLQYFYIGQIISNSLIMLTKGKPIAEQNLFSWHFLKWMFVLVIFAYSCQIFITRSVFLVAASKVMPFNYVLVVVSFLADIVIFHHSFDALAIIGILVVCLGLLYLIRMEGKTEKTEDSKALRKASTVSQEGV